MWGNQINFTCKCGSKSWVYSMFSSFATRCLTCRGISEGMLYGYQNQFENGLLTLEEAEKEV